MQAPTRRGLINLPPFWRMESPQQMNGWKLRVESTPGDKDVFSFQNRSFFQVSRVESSNMYILPGKDRRRKTTPISLGWSGPRNVGPSNLSRNGVKELERLDVKPQIDSFHPDFVLIVLELERFLLGGHFFLMCEFQHEDLGPAISDSNVPYEK